MHLEDISAHLTLQNASRRIAGHCRGYAPITALLCALVWLCSLYVTVRQTSARSLPLLAGDSRIYREQGTGKQQDSWHSSTLSAYTTSDHTVATCWLYLLYAVLNARSITPRSDWTLVHAVTRLVFNTSTIQLWPFYPHHRLVGHTVPPLLGTAGMSLVI